MPVDRPASPPPPLVAGPPSPRVMRVLAPAKLNLHLRVGPPRTDGFHPLLTWMCTAALFDSLTIQVRPLEVGERGERVSPGHEPAGPAARGAPHDAAAGEAGAVDLTCDLPGLPCGADNLVVRIARAWQQRRQQQAALRGPGVDAGRGQREAVKAAAAAAVETRSFGGQVGKGEQIDVTLGKQIPVGAGLGGGSSDAARTLLALDRLDDARLPAKDLSDFAAQFGSDLSFFVYGGSAVCRGRGEEVTPIAPPTARWAALVLPSAPMPTPAVYRRFDEMGLGQTADVEREPDWNAWTNLPAEQLLSRLVNDLEAPAFAIAPTLGTLRADAEQLLGRPVRMSGSGSSLFSLFDEESEARSAAEQLSARFRQRTETVELAANFADDLNGFGA